MSTKYPSSAVLIEMSFVMTEKDIKANVQWTPREVNREADRLATETQTVSILRYTFVLTCHATLGLHSTGHWSWDSKHGNHAGERSWLVVVLEGRKRRPEDRKATDPIGRGFTSFVDLTRTGFLVLWCYCVCMGTNSRRTSVRLQLRACTVLVEKCFSASRTVELVAVFGWCERVRSQECSRRVLRRTDAGGWSHVRRVRTYVGEAAERLPTEVRGSLGHQCGTVRMPEAW